MIRHHGGSTGKNWGFNGGHNFSLCLQWMFHDHIPMAEGGSMKICGTLNSGGWSTKIS